MNQIDRFQSQPTAEVLVLTSPKAGSGSGRDQIPRLIDLGRQQGVPIEIVSTVDQLQKGVAAAAGRAVVVAAGGDGTLGLAAQSLAADVPLVPMPMGTENLLARHFGHHVDAEAVWETVRRGPVFRLDAGLANGRLFLIMASCGFDAEVVRAMHLTRRGHINRFSYAGPIIRAIRKYKFPAIKIRIDEDESGIPDCGWCMVFNLPKYAANLAIEPDAVGDDGLLDLIGMQKGSVPSGLKYTAAVALRRHLKLRDVFRRRGTVIELTSAARIPYQLDGDYVGRLPLRIETLPGRVQLLLPPGGERTGRHRAEPAKKDP